MRVVKKASFEDIKEILMKEFDSVYCDTCSSNESCEYCDGCYRKYMNWSISEATAEYIANKILNG